MFLIVFNFVGFPYFLINMSLFIKVMQRYETFFNLSSILQNIFLKTGETFTLNSTVTYEFNSVYAEFLSVLVMQRYETFLIFPNFLVFLFRNHLHHQNRHRDYNHRLLHHQVVLPLLLQPMFLKILH